MRQDRITKELLIAPERPLDIDAGDVLTRLQRGWVTLLLFVLGGAVLGALYTWMVRPVWEANASVVFPAINQSPGSGLAASMGIALPGQSGSPIKINRGVLESRRARLYVSSHSGVPERKLRTALTAKDDPPSSLLSFSVRYKDPKQALRIAGLYLDALMELNRTLSLPQARTQVTLLKQQLDEKSEQLRIAEERQRRFQRSSKTAPGVDPTTGTLNRYAQQLNQAEVELAKVRASITEARSKLEGLASPGSPPPAELAPAKQWRDKLANLEYDLRVEELTYGQDAPSVVRLKGQIALARRQLNDEMSRYLSVVRSNSEPSLATLEADRVGLEAQVAVLRVLAERAPSESVEMLRLVREVSVLGALLQQIRTQYEAARLQVASDPNRWELLDPPALANDGRPVNKRWLRNPLLTSVLGFLVGCAFALLRTRPAARGPVPLPAPSASV